MNYILHIIAMTGIVLPAILGYNLVLGKGKILHFGPIAVGIVTAYAVVIPLMKWGSWPLAIGVGLLAALLVSLLFAWLALRLDGDGFGILSIAMHLSIFAVVVNWSDLTRGALGITMIPRMPLLGDLGSFAAASVVVSALWIWLMIRIDRSSLGRSLTALAEHRSYAESLGIDRRRTYAAAFLIAGLGSLLTNVLYPQYIGILHPNDYEFVFLIFFIMCIVAGRPGSVLGVTLSTVLLETLKEGLRFVPLPYGLLGPLRLVLFGIILIVAVWVRRKELFPMQRTV